MSCADACQRIARGLVFAALGLVCAGCADEGDSAVTVSGDGPSLQIKLPPELREVSGLAATAAGTVLAVADEQALVFEIDIEAARVQSRLQIGDPILVGDFEGIEQVGDQIYLVDSKGVVVEANAGASKGFSQTDTGIGDDCEIEGLGHDPTSGLLYLLCKQQKGKKAPKHLVQLFAYSTTERALVPDAHLQFDAEQALDTLDKKRLSPSGVVFSADGQQITVIAAKQQALLVFARTGALLTVETLPKSGRHRQTEGVALLADGRLVLADEGGNKAGRLSVYPHVQR